jgi:hypothetical protein
MNKILLLSLVVLSTLLSGLPAKAAVTKIQESNAWSYIIPKDRDGQRDLQANFAPPSLLVSGNWTTCVLGHTGKGVVAGISFSGNVIDQQQSQVSVALYDSTIIGSHSAGTIDTNRVIFTSKVDTYRQNQVFSFSPPIPYTNGLIVCNGSSTIQTQVRFFKQQS